MIFKFHKNQEDVRQCGRSMVEMLGVLAIIGVLSVGAIAGYQKAMFQYKMNKTVAGYNQLFGYLKTHHQDFETGESNLTTLLIKLKVIDKSTDPMGHYFFVRRYDDYFDLNIYLSNSYDNSSDVKNYCKNMLTSLIRPSRDMLKHIVLLTGIGGDETQPSAYKSRYYGDEDCTGSKECIRDMDLEKTDTFCSLCTEGQLCRLVVRIL